MIRFAPFAVDVTPPIGHPLGGGFVPPAAALRDPLYARGLILDDRHTRVVLCAIDFCVLDNSAHRQVSEALARGARTVIGYVTAHTVHQHDAPSVRADAEPLLRKQGLGQLNKTWWASVTNALERAAAAARRRMQPLVAVGVGETRLAGCASNRRLIGPDGKVRAMRSSMCTDPKLQAWTVGLIDPLLRAVTLWGEGNRLLATMSFYATHPQSAYRRGLISADSIGEALRWTRKRFPAAHHVYFSGCGANVTFGKYATTDPERNITQFGRRIAGGIARAIAASRLARVQPNHFQWRVRNITLPFRPRFRLPQARKCLADKSANPVERIRAAIGLASAARAKRMARVRVQSLKLGPARVVYLPSEVFVEYQLYAQSLRPEEFVAVAAHGNGKLQYLPTTQAFAEGGYETGPQVCLTTPAVERILKKSIQAVLKE
ncbi:MAG: neutral/alkaline non-lysosomal ceramidase N-terminal domain-containing protein [Verrucomicrobia bacterium]|nr:neutral/alkaline non-lysosomal ceramidase N-terminal domain-containing protein [Verrucomicrobiota bacterium]